MLANLIYKLFPEDEWEYDGLRIHRMLVEDIDKFNELNLLNDKDSLLFYKKMEKDIGSRYKYMNELTKLRFVQNYLSDNEKMFFSIKLGKEMIGFIYAIECDRKYFINILIKEEYRKKEYGRNAIRYLKELLFENDEIICDSIVFDSEYENDEVGKFFIKCGFIKDRELYSDGKELIDTTGKFIMKNESQIKKELVSSKHIDKPIVFKEYKNNNPYLDEIDCLKETILEIHKENPNHRILILGRKNRMIDNLRYDSAFEDGIGSRINFVNHNDIYIDGMTMHKAKGLAYDQVIIMGLYKNFPSESFVKNWYVNLYTNKKVEELIRYAEERRLFYVAMTRTKNKVYLLYNEEPKLRSSFVDEIKNIVNKNNDKDSLY